MKNINKYYVYVYLDPRKPGKHNYGEYEFDYEPFYVGKGQGTRIYSHLYEAYYNIDNNSFKCNKIRKIKRITKNNPILIKYKESLFHKEALDLETSMIKNIGRKNIHLGPLTNMTDGGEGMSEITDEIREKISINRIGKTAGKNHPLYGKHHSKEAKRKMSLARLGKSPSNKGKKHSKESIKKMKEKMLGNTHRLTYKYLLIDPNGIKYNNITKLDNFCKQYNLQRCGVQASIKHNRKYKNWIVSRDLIK